ncbi:jhy protein homolog [Empidonax traillii]|uniref:jhy protein homolog n=1 Tax=Empidonax traillii TaxID=164674 RepID=UPI000FFD8BFF|nr:jhy protein homolog [Empidonax traillii]
MKPSALKHITVFSPHTHTLNKIHVPPKVLVPPVFHPPKWRRALAREGGSACSLQDCQDSDSESLPEEGQDQLGLQQRILEKEELLGLCSDELDNDSLEEDSLEEVSSGEDPSPNGTQKDRGKKQSVDKYSSLRYSPKWKNTRKAGKASQAGGSSVDFSQESFYLHSSGSSEEKSQEEAEAQDSFSEFSSEFLSFHDPNVLVSNEPLGLQAKKKESADGCQSRDRPQRAKKNFVKKNKQTLGLPSERINSYLELHNKKQQVLQEQVTDPKAVEEEEPPPQTVKKKPEDNLKGQQLKPRGPKVCINLNVKLGGLGPDYEAIKEKKQKLKLQKEYSRQIKEYNMKNITSVQKLPAKPQVTPSVSRQKALEYAKKIPRPKTFMTRPSDKEGKEEVVPQSSDGSSFPQIPSLETLRSRHEKEKEVVAAFKALHIL